MLLMVYVRQEILPNIRAEASEAQGTGIMGMMVCRCLYGFFLPPPC